MAEEIGPLPAFPLLVVGGSLVHALDADTLSLWRFDETSGPTTSDAAGNELDGMLSPTVMRVLSDR